MRVFLLQVRTDCLILKKGASGERWKRETIVSENDIIQRDQLAGSGEPGI